MRRLRLQALEADNRPRSTEAGRLGGCLTSFCETCFSILRMQTVGTRDAAAAAWPVGSRPVSGYGLRQSFSASAIVAQATARSDRSAASCQTVTPLRETRST